MQMDWSPGSAEICSFRNPTSPIYRGLIADIQGVLTVCFMFDESNSTLSYDCKTLIP